MDAKGPLLLIDGHVHLYACFEIERLLEAAFSNFRTVAARYERAERFSGVLMLTETSRDDVFESVFASAAPMESAQESANSWRLFRTAEGTSLIARRGQAALVLVAGRQIVTRERLEILALGTTRCCEDGRSADETILNVRASGGVPVLPWGVGKWLGARGRKVEQTLAAEPPRRAHVGDNSGRPWFWPRPRLFRLAEAHGLKVLPGTDPLPLPSEAVRVGSFGFGLFASLPPQRPAAAVKRLIEDPGQPLFSFGRLETLPRFLRNQVRIRLA